MPSGPPRNLIALPISSTSIVLTWDPPLLHERNGIITNYTIILMVDGISTVFTTNVTTLTAVGLHPFTTYIFNVLAFTNIGTGPSSPMVTETTLEDGMSYYEKKNITIILTLLY